MGSEFDRTPAGMLAAIESIKGQVGQLSAHFQAVVDHLAGGSPPAEVPTEPPAPPPAEPTPAETNVASAIASLTPEQKAAIRALLGG